MSGVRDGGENGEDGETRRGKACEREGWRERERETGGTGEEWGISENRGTSQRCRVSRSDFHPQPDQVSLPILSSENRPRGGWIMRATFVFFSSGRNKKKKDLQTTYPICREPFFCFFCLIKRDKQGMIH